MPTPRKLDAVKELAADLSQAQLVVLADYRGLSVSDIGKLRRDLRKSETQLSIAKNTLIKLAAEQTGVETSINDMLAGPTAIAFVRTTDIARSAKALSDYARVSKTFSIKGAVLGKRVVNASRVQEIADLPPREVLVGRVLGTMQAPIAGLVTVLGGTVRSLLYALQARSDQLNAQQGG
ncbi:MAG: 50S ribosomal protein L10 [Chloroflexota bacterium]